MSFALAVDIARVAFHRWHNTLTDARYIAIVLYVEAMAHDEANPGTATIQDIARVFRLSQSSASVLVNALISDGWLMRKRSRADHRMYPLKCTAKTLQTLRRARLRFDGEPQAIEENEFFTRTRTTSISDE